MNTEKRNNLARKSFILMALLVLFLMPSALALTNATFGLMGVGVSTYTFSAQLSSQGVTQSLIPGDSIQFSRKTSTAYETYTLTLNEILGNSVNLILNTNSNDFSIKLGETKKLSLSSNGFYDLSVKLESVSEGNVELTIQTIHELIQIEQQTQSSANTTNINKINNKTNSSKFFTKTNIIGGAIIIAVLIFIIYIRNLRRRLRSFQPSSHGSYRVIK